jgi:hypothetical protein
MTEICRSESGTRPKRYHGAERALAYGYLRAILSGNATAIKLIERTTQPRDLERALAAIALECLQMQFGDALTCDLWLLAEQVAAAWDETLGPPDLEAE